MTELCGLRDLGTGASNRPECRPADRASGRLGGGNRALHGSAVGNPQRPSLRERTGASGHHGARYFPLNATPDGMAIAKWLENTKGILRSAGAMYTTWEDKYDAMDVWARRAWGGGRAR
jgi:hypothetical protein